MEEALRCMLQYKTRCSQLKQDKAALAAAYEARVQQCQTTISRLSQENEALKKQVKTLEAQQQGGGAVQQALLERLRALESDNRLLSTDAEQQRRQYERCLDDVANQVVRALLSQKGLREEIGALQQRIRELEGQNRALTSLLVQQLQNGEQVRQDFKQITAGEVTSPEQGAADDMVTLSKPRLRRPTGRHRPSPTCGGQAHDDTTAAILAAVASIDPALWLQVARPQSLHLAPSLEGAQEMVARDGRDGSATDLSSWQQDIKQAVAEAEAAAAAAVGASSSVDGVDAMAEAVAAAVAEDDQDGSSSPESSPESGNRDEGYSTMSSDVQAEASSRLTGTGLGLLGLGLGACTELEDVKEEAEQVLPDVVAELGRQPAAGAAAGRLLLLDLQALNVRHSFPPARDLQAVLRNSFSDSHLCLSRLLHHAAAASFASTPASCPAATAHKPVLLVDLGAGHAAATAKPHPLRRARATPSLLTPPLPPLQLVAEELAEHGDEEDLGLAAGWWDADYVQHWLRLDETRSALQQRHREAYELEYDQAELEDWSLSLSCEELDLSWRRTAPAPPPAPVEAPGSTHGNPQLPIIQENNSLELEEDASECLWNNASYLDAGPAAVGGGPRGCHGAGLGLGLGGAGWPYALSLVEQADAMISSLAVNAAGSSPGGSWSSSAAASDCYDCCLNGCHGEEGSSKRSSAALSGCSDESAATGTSAASRESPSAVGTDFTRDFYRLVKFESTKSLASNSSSRNSRGQGQGHHGDNNINNNLPTSMDREQALQSVLKFIAEQQKYCHSREEQDSATELGSRPVSYAYSMEEEGAGPAEPGAEPPESIESLEPVSLSTFSEVDIDVDADLDVLDLEAANGEEQQQVSLEGQEDSVATGVTAVTALLDEISVAAGVTASLETVLEDEELDTTPSGRRQLQSLREAPSSPAPAAAAAAASAPTAVSVLVCDANDKAVSFHENATSKDVIDELNRMIRKGEGEEAAPAVSADAHPRPKCGRPPGEAAAAASVDSAALSCPTGWVHVERDIDFTDPKVRRDAAPVSETQLSFYISQVLNPPLTLQARANLLDVMLASSASSGSMSSSGSESGDAEDLPADYRHLHRLHRFRRHKKGTALALPGRRQT
ncbi:hypothetical protein ONE63_005634 [Megalurothrips usitatus]|uniref:Nck-associated protein 5 n=1 Tax=Megalurothrips usitatus TaxID=439358 RepID=A0AAV7XW76_9NEOP|nr:hypothetical protein ONE63_005634 [Megalurothrips usitatus]